VTSARPIPATPADELPLRHVTAFKMKIPAGRNCRLFHGHAHLSVVERPAAAQRKVSALIAALPAGGGRRLDGQRGGGSPQLRSIAASRKWTVWSHSVSRQDIRQAILRPPNHQFAGMASTFPPHPFGIAGQSLRSRLMD
jgi:hypothetical protein